MKTVITAGSLFTPLEVIESPVVLIEDGRVMAVSSRRQMEEPAQAEHFDFPQMIVAPGFIDIHVHGNAGHDVMKADQAARDAKKAAELAPVIEAALTRKKLMTTIAPSASRATQPIASQRIPSFSDASFGVRTSASAASHSPISSR